jgi:serine protease Do
MRKHCIVGLLVILCPILLLAVSWAWATGKEDRIADVVETTSKAIVNIKTEEWAKKTNEGDAVTVLKRFFAGDEEGEEGETFENIGSGVVLDSKGIIVTNEHLVSKAVNIRVKFTNKQEYDAYVLATDPELDVALLKVEGKQDFPSLKVNLKKNIRVGERTIVIGNPYGLSSTVTTGVVSALGRNLKINNKIYANLIQTDAAINPGSSGGGLLDIDGNLLGIVTAIYEEGKGIGFAIPIEDVMSMVSEFLDTTTKRPIFGAFIEKRRDEKGIYIYVVRIIPGSPAEKHGIRVGDRIVEFNKKRIKEGMKVSGIFRSALARESCNFRVIRGAKTFTVAVSGDYVGRYVPSPVDELLCGLRLADIKGYVRLKYKLREKSGVVVTKVNKGGIGERYGLKAGDVILKINNSDLPNKEEFQALMVEGLRRNYVLFQIRRTDNVFFLPIKLDTLL